MPRATESCGFTLIELLVVITIIVVLLALLAPALDKAVYQATLVQCMANQKLLASTCIVYAHDHRRMYPYRDLPTNPIDSEARGVEAHKLAHPRESGSGMGDYDLRPMFRPYVSINKVFQDPFIPEPVDLDKDEPAGGSSLDTHVYGSLFLWSGWEYPNRPGMRRLGDRFEAATQNGPPRRFSLLVGDIDAAQGTAYANHPDRDYLRFQVVQDEPFPLVPGTWITVAQWTRAATMDDRAPAAPHRAPMDLNYAYSDGSVIGHRKVVYPRSEGMTRIRNYNLGETRRIGGWNHVPIH